MRTVIIIIIILSVIAASIFGYVLIKYIQGKGPPAEETTEEEPPDTTAEEEQEPETTTEEEPEEEEEADPEKIAVIEVYLDGNRKSGILLGEAEYGLNSEQASMVYGENLSETGYSLAIDNEDYTFVPGSTYYFFFF